MTSAEVFVVAFLAVFAMVGGALLNAAITAPRRCLSAIKLMSSSRVFRTFEILLAAFAGVSAAALAGLLGSDFPIGKPVAAIVVAGSGGLALLIWACVEIAHHVKDQDDQERR
ncbi:hypothetical protein [Paracoccus sp. (in: a-proteobacteria)]|uniref:hypothetical protein n=1 Tax=Paracoccus sp. TaxID=267 RepID=UPI00258C7147|nr:hypothetical protein [Paracoccus sp. (in: a-proteobacteria)]